MGEKAAFPFPQVAVVDIGGHASHRRDAAMGDNIVVVFRLIPNLHDFILVERAFMRHELPVPQYRDRETTGIGSHAFQLFVAFEVLPETPYYYAHDISLPFRP